jgi:RNA polymerase sigma factor (sigma-70 family)
MTEPSTEDLLDRWLRGDEAAGEVLCARYLARAKDFADRIAGREFDADEIAAEAVAAGLEGLRGGSRPDRMTAWLHGIIRNLIRHRIRDKQARAVLPDRPAPVPAGIPTRAARREQEQLLDELLPRLTPKEREVIHLFRKGLNREDIAKRLGIDVNAVNARFKRAFRQLREGFSKKFTTLVVRTCRTSVTWGEIRNLRPSFRQAVIVRHLEGKRRSDAARQLGIPPDTLDARLQTAYEVLRCDESADFAAARAEWLRQAGSNFSGNAIPGEPY